MKLFSRFRSSEVKISSPHAEKNSPVAAKTLEAKFRGGAFEPNDQYFSGKKVLSSKREYSINPEKWELSCSLGNFADVSTHLTQIVELRNKCTFEHYLMLDTAADQVFLLACASAATSALKHSQGDPASWKQVDLVSTRAVSALACDIRTRFAELRQKNPVELGSLHYYTPQAERMALRYISLLVISLAYERGTKVNAEVVNNVFDTDWSSKKAKAILRETFGSVQTENQHPNWPQLQHILNNAESYCRKTPRPDFGGYHQSHTYGSTSSTSSNSTQGGYNSGRTTPNPPAQAEATSGTPTGKTAYDAALSNVRGIIAAIIGKMPPELQTTPQCGYSSAGNLTGFFNMSATDRGEQAQTRVKQQYRAILRAIHPDKHAEKDAEVRRAFADCTKQYTAAHEEATKWFGTQGA